MSDWVDITLCVMYFKFARPHLREDGFPNVSHRGAARLLLLMVGKDAVYVV